MRRVTILVAAASLALAAVVAPATAVENPTVITGTLGDANYEIRVPANWNGTVFVYAHGYRDAADQIGETDDTSAPVGPRGIDATEDDIADALLARGYAVAGSSYSSNGWAVEDAIGDTAALTEFFAEEFGEPANTILWGTSMGSVVTFALAEQRSDLYDGFLAMCAVGAGSSRAWDGGLVLATAYEVAFGWPSRWGLFDDVKNTIDFETEVLYPTVGSLIDPADFGLWEFVRLVSNLPAEEFYGDDANWALTDMYFATEARAELERRAGGPVGRTDIYADFTLSDGDIAYLEGLGVNAEAMLAELNVLKEKRNPTTAESRAYIRTYADYTGDISDPMLTLHTTVDGLVPVEHESAYRETIEAAHNQRLLVQLYVDDVGHCTFTGEELLAAADAIADWVIRRDKPSPNDFAGVGRFDPDFEPDPWPFVRLEEG